MKKQQGMILFYSLVVLIIMTVIGVALAVNSSQSMKMAGAGSERMQAMAAAQGSQNRVVDQNQGTTLANMVVTEDIYYDDLGVENTLTPLDSEDVNCQRNTEATMVSAVKCRRIEISSFTEFGKNDLGQLTVVLAVEQEVLTGS